MSELISTICPNCGANATNKDCCEFCGSALVRFTANNIHIDPKKYGKEKDAEISIIHGLEKALNDNLNKQKRYFEKFHSEKVLPKLIVEYDVYYKKKYSVSDITDIGPRFITNVVENRHDEYIDDAMIISFVNTTFLKNAYGIFQDKIGVDITLEIFFPTIDIPKGNSDVQVKNARKALEYFETMDIYPLFTEYRKGNPCISYPLGDEMLYDTSDNSFHDYGYYGRDFGGFAGDCYYISLGQDTRTAAQIVSQIIYKLKEEGKYNLYEFHSGGFKYCYLSHDRHRFIEYEYNIEKCIESMTATTADADSLSRMSSCSKRIK